MRITRKEGQRSAAADLRIVGRLDLRIVGRLERVGLPHREFYINEQTETTDGEIRVTDSRPEIHPEIDHVNDHSARIGVFTTAQNLPTQHQTRAHERDSLAKHASQDASTDRHHPDRI